MLLNDAENVTLRNGLTSREREQRVGRIVAAAVGAYLLLCFLVPLVLPEGTVPELSGRANALDYASQESWGNLNHGDDAKLGHDQPSRGTFAWSELNPFWGFVYAFGDLNCHQKHERSWEINGNQMPVCTRDIGIFIGLFIGAALFGLRGVNRWTVRDTFLSVFPDEKIETLYLKDRRMVAMLLLIGIGIAPMGIDGFTQLLTGYESTNPVRVVTGLFSGLVIGWWFSAALCARAAFFDEDATRVSLPANARLMMK
ncbi:MAG: DUF2085 domain-containing protein [Candidatus Thermoplasmatota archaeon]|nr:hypothetical protein [Euryarchaeota archaeon]MAM99641.1 hypothetical protein [Euryarchaeota archaeon]MBO53363.1 hypothetical protein [Euryarchaeota archaeon]MED5452513.1 DUF2085 domain-containing protein [Candidatus Thermoplasmatota archaeon]|tara:strand:- start:13929 stop:14696 length:768 start_codon:yes stop_codon:yes gene_type:complete